MPRDLEADQEMLRNVLALAQRGAIGDAADLADKAIGDGFEHPLLLNILATRYEHEGRFEEALALLERALRLAPDDIGVRNALSLCLQRLDRPHEALPHVDRILKLRPDLAFAHANRGNALIAIGDLGKAQQAHRRALELDPDNVAAQGALASIATHRGDHEEARGLARKVLEKLPGFPNAMLSLAAADLAGGSLDTAQTLIAQVLVDTRVGPREKARASGLLGDVLDAAGRYADAFKAYSACNQALQHAYRKFTEGTGIVPYTESIIAAMGRVDAPLWATAPAGADDAVAADAPSSHVFLIGFPRSGTTLLEVVLDGHPKVASLEEHELLKPAVLAFMREPLDFAPLLRADAATLRELRADYWRQVRAAGVEPRGSVFVDKHPLHTLKLPLIGRLFPRARILFAYRDPRDVVLSCFRRRFSLNPAMYQLLSLEGGAAFYDATMRMALQARERMNLAWKDVRYEDLVGDFDRELRGICEFLGLEWMPRLADFAARAQDREHATPSTAQLARGLDRSGGGHWRHYQEALAPVLPTLAPWAQRFGYSD